MDMMNTLLMLITAVGVMLTAWQLHFSVKAQRAHTLKELYMALYADDRVVHGYYCIEHDNLNFDNARGFFVNGAAEEQAVDAMLSLFDLVCSLYFRGIITGDEMMNFDYRLKRVGCHAEVGNYFRFLDKVFREDHLENRPFDNLRRYCKLKWSAHC